jgi:hypothetical protein
LIKLRHLVIEVLPPQAKRAIEADDFTVDGKPITDTFAND